MTEPRVEPPPAAKFEEVLEAEIDYLWRQRHASKARGEVVSHLVGLALSGGGIRSATTCLGVLQALSKMQILPLVDYLSTVSGGGYIGACLTSLLSLTEHDVKRAPDASPRSWTPPGKAAAEPAPAFTYQAGDRRATGPASAPNGGAFPSEPSGATGTGGWRPIW
jgi:hypothetical protein